ncbi:glyoxalase/bleomycin resistance protein/dioxygenase superfamily protein [Glaciihabitans tibetensis]|uniref:Glyoxalase/bleomycin resistance protein/dioxygenase superfamily protein n=2 Tax=Glaciihabitans tibetensis TaxID=1266600 RepID=A0A2T0VAN8_9MICO|nr:VOC family protein [Glaciihabitans tibetensis]PRY67221.1 glyoxalase/bleomycin resistance protein/dioxygenase superfamily protein [Glaciihabitans tibetensis]
MLKEAHTVLPAKDLQRARQYYHDKLGLDPDQEHEGLVTYHTDGGTYFDLYETPNAGTAQNTQMCWSTDDIEAEMRQLREHGVVFEDYDVPGLKTVDGIATDADMRTAWFRDSEGNFLCVTQML